MSTAAATIRKLNQQLARERSARIRAARRNPHKKRKAPSKETQIKMVKGALASKKTPQHFIPSLRKRLRKLTGAAVMLFVLSGCAVRPAKAQTSVQPFVYQQPLATATPCTGSAQIFPVNNRNQTQHIVSLIVSSGTPNTLAMEIDGKDLAGNLFRLSDVAEGNFGSLGTSVSAAGYYPFIQVQVTCSGV